MSLTSTDSWQFWIDRGGTFTDVVAQRPDGRIETAKLLSENPEQYKDAAIEGIRRFLGTPPDEAIPTAQVDAVKMGTTVGTNALLERNGEPTVLITTKGFGDQLRIGYQARPDIFARHIVLPEMLYDAVVEVDERYSAKGDLLQAFDAEAVRADLTRMVEAGYKSCAIIFMHGYRYTDHEKQVAQIARDVGFEQVSTSHETSALMKFVSRGDTTVVDAYLSPILRRYVDQVSGALGDTRLMFMQSNGGLTDAALFQGRDCILSGPAGGIVGAVRTAAVAGFDHIIGFDMGGTSTDVAHYAGEYERSFETTIAGARIRAPMMHIHTVAAGGGSICHFDGTRYRVGPESAGANPGPAGYRRGGPLTVTDCNIMLGKLQPDFFPKVFGPNADEALDADTVRDKFEALAKDISDGRSAADVAAGFLQIAVLNMASAIKQISVQRGYDISDYILQCFGGAGGQHACLVADALGVQRILIHPYAGVLSAYGMGLADTRAMREQAVETVLNRDNLHAAVNQIQLLAKETRDELLMQKIDKADMRHLHKVHLKYTGTDTALAVELGTMGELKERFEEQYKKQFGFTMADKALVIDAISVESIGSTEEAEDRKPDFPDRADGYAEMGRYQVHMDGATHDTPVFDRDVMRPGDQVDGPAIIREATGTNVIEPGWQAEMNDFGHLILTRITPLPKQVAAGTDTADPVLLEVFNNLYMSIAEQMGLVLENTSYSVNIKERLDFSCAVFDAQGNLIANAPHMPVHLGSMGESIKSIIHRRAGTMKPGDVYMLNDPYHGGTHLPDITVVTPVFNDEEREVLFYVASRGHHADIGGRTPGFMPPDSVSIAEEGILIDNFELVQGGHFQEAAVRDLFTTGEYPARNIDQNIADLKAQIAANTKGVSELRRMVDHFGLDVVQAYMDYVQDNAEEQVRRVIANLSDGQFSLALDNGAKIELRVIVDQDARSAVLDFEGTSDQLDNNFNAPYSICRAAALYVFRTLVDDDIPMNDGCLKPVDIRVPKGSMLNPTPPAAVVAGNVETSQCITEALYGALGVMASAQGTMNNFTFGNDQYQYYETICGGSGAGPGFDGTDAVHTHMTNSRLTDPEVIEWRFPVIVEEFAIREGSGGTGQYTGGNGVVRRIKFLEEMEASILANHREIPPFGMDGGAPGALGRNWVERVDGVREDLGGTGHVHLNADDVFVIETPGGGGYGLSEDIEVAAE